MFGSVFLDQIMHCKIKVICFFQTVAGFFKSLGSDRIQYDITLRNRISGTDHTEFEFVAGECKR